MENMFKRTLLCAAISAAAMASTTAHADIDLLDGKVQVYGQAAGFMMYGAVDGDHAVGKAKEDTITANIESRIGFRGKVNFDNFAPTFVWQIEGGDASNSGGNAGGTGSFGGRDTFVGLEFDGLGTVKFGRQLVAAYNYVDWPHTNPGLGNVFDWNNDIAASYEDRANNTIRFDSANFGGFNVQATVSNMGQSTDAAAFSIAGSYTTDMFTVHAGHYLKTDHDFSIDDGGVIKPVTDGENAYTVVGGQLFLGDVTLSAAAKYMTSETDKGENSQWAYSATAQYVANGTWLYKAGFAMTSEADIAGEGKKADSEDMAITGRIGYLLPSAIIYSDVRHYNMNGDTDTLDGTNFLLGVEYYF